MIRRSRERAPGLVNPELRYKRRRGYGPLSPFSRGLIATWVEKAGRRVFDPFSSSSSFSFTSSFLLVDLPALVRATSTLDLEHVLHTTRHLPWKSWMCHGVHAGRVHVHVHMRLACSSACFFSCLRALTSPSRCIFVHASERRERRWRRLILPRAELFRKAKDDKGRSELLESRRTGEARSYVYSSPVLAETIMFKNNDRELA